ncbi:MAG: hypothetical protein RL255_457 [Actinomycetota bacterium]|jgi:hypothetical protein
MSNENLDRISEIKKRVNEIGLAPLEEHGKRFEEVHSELTEALSAVEGISNS